MSPLVFFFLFDMMLSWFGYFPVLVLHFLVLVLLATYVLCFLIIFMCIFLSLLFFILFMFSTYVDIILCLLCVGGPCYFVVLVHMF